MLTGLADGELRDGADVAELTGMLPDLAAAGWPDRMRVIVRRERPHPGAQLSFSDMHGYRFQAFVTDTQLGQLAHLEARHRAHARVEDRIRTGKDTGLGRFPSRQFNINAVWLELSLLGCDLLAWTQTMLLNDELARCEPKAAAQRHVARLVGCCDRHAAAWPAAVAHGEPAADAPPALGARIQPGHLVRAGHRALPRSVAEPDCAWAGSALYRNFIAPEGRRILRGAYRKAGTKLSTPTRVLAGVQDTNAIIRPEHVSSYDEYGDDLKLEVVDGAAHFIAEERPDTVVERALKFFANR